VRPFSSKEESDICYWNIRTCKGKTKNFKQLNTEEETAHKELTALRKLRTQKLVAYDKMTTKKIQEGLGNEENNGTRS
jgi:hypothetical protein